MFVLVFVVSLSIVLLGVKDLLDTGKTVRTSEGYVSS